MKVSVVYGATLPLRRPLYPGIHQRIPVAAIINDDTPLAYETPTPIREQLLEAQGRSDT